MAIITFISDFGYNDHYVASVKAQLLSAIPDVNIVDISHNIEHYNIAHGSFVLKYVYPTFPKGTIHLVAINCSESKRFLALELDDHFFFGPDNGIYGLISNKEPSNVVELEKNNTSHFPAYDILTPAVIAMIEGKNMEEIGQPTEKYQRLLPRQVKANKKQISGNVLRVNSYGNLITNISKTEFKILNKNNDFQVIFGREKFRKIHQTSRETEPGDCYVLFNELGLLEIGINKGNASELLGMDYDSPVHIIFNE